MSERVFDTAHFVGRKIRHRRWQMGETQLSLADRLGIPYTDLQLYESGVRTVPFGLLERVAEVQETSIDFYTDVQGQ